MAVRDLDFASLQREAEARRLGVEMYRQAAAMSHQTVEDLAAVLSALANRTGGRLIRELASAYAREMMADAARNHYEDLGAAAYRPDIPSHVSSWPAGSQAR